MKKTLYLIILALMAVAAVVLAGCTGQQPPSPQPPVVSHGGPVTDYVSLIDNLRAAGATVEVEGEITQPFFAVEGNIVIVNGGSVQVFEYTDVATAEAEAALVSPDGSSVGTTMVGWVATPHFYKVGRLIVLYVGDDTAVINMLEAELGSQFAGR